ncbi:conserved hypothetical protein [Magnetospirillum sp. LM-5]|uniref:SGNH/GDSL hydrolase family protein n=1 Tax=Magnetospirillum sp. LM-5 TaxID=2681466 RepID=UPI0013842DBB|nr:SGNH/GDSL hydrolase family protein [Magnetospirillum sp. LM-5]CAA7617629.1 conserved hypothetical protein [Magnetospirillum sp. LM-5]
MRRRRLRTRAEFNPLAALARMIPRLCLLLLVLLPVAELGAGIALPRIPEPRPNASSTLSDQQISQLYGVEDAGPVREMQAEMRDLGDAGYWPLVEYRMKPFAGKHVTVGPDGWRAVPRVEGEGAKVFVFGGAAVFGTGNADGQTIPAYLDTLLLEAGKSARVFNFGVPGWISTQERIALEQMVVAGNKPDLAIFVDGFEDLRRCDGSDRTAFSEQLAATEAKPSLATMLAHSALAKLVGRLRPPPAKGLLPLVCTHDSEVERALARLEVNRRMISAMADRLGFKVLFVQQPVPTFAYDNAKRLVPVSPAEMAPLVGVAKGYSRLAEARAAGRPTDPETLWLAELEPATGNAYVDIVDYSPSFNRAIAEAVARHVLDKSLLP